MIRSLVALAGIVLVGACTKSPPTNGASSSGGGGASSTESACPKDPQAAVGTSCAPEGATCGTDPSGFTHFIMCQRGKWSEMEAPPPPPPPAHS